MRAVASWTLRLVGVLLLLEGFEIVPLMTMIGLEGLEPLVASKLGVALGLLAYFAGEDIARRDRWW